MGNNFLMSKRLNKQYPEDFGLISSEDSDTYLKQDDHSLWKSRPLYDFGWGKENGYYKIPIPDFDGLVDIIMTSKEEDDKYGAAAVILDEYGDELLEKCFEILDDSKSSKNYSEFFMILNLKAPINRSSIWCKNDSQISEDLEKWKAVADKIGNM